MLTWLALGLSNVILILDLNFKVYLDQYIELVHRQYRHFIIFRE